MASRQSIQNEIQALLAQNRPDAFDIVRRQKIERVRNLTGRSLVIFAVEFPLQNPIKAQVVSGSLAISLNDKDGFDGVTRNLPRDVGLDIMLHSPGGSAEATESIVELLRARFTSIRFIVPGTAKSAATMMAMAGDEILMDEVSELGPTDPQLLIVRDNQVISAPAQAIKDQFEAAQEEINGDPSRLPAWVPILREYGPSLLAECDNHLALSQELVSKWLEKYMFAMDEQGEQKARHVGQHLADHRNFKSHARRVGLVELQGLGLHIVDLRTQPELHDAIRDLYATVMLTFANTGAYKMFENSQDEASIDQLAVTTEPQQPQAPTQTQPPARPQLVPPQEGQQIRAERRRQQKEQGKQRKRGNPGR